jgi:hypothetical protein
MTFSANSAEWPASISTARTLDAFSAKRKVKAPRPAPNSTTASAGVKGSLSTSFLAMASCLKKFWPRNFNGGKKERPISLSLGRGDFIPNRGRQSDLAVRLLFKTKPEAENEILQRASE